MNEYTASNGVVVRDYPSNAGAKAVRQEGHFDVPLGVEAVQALREFFAAELGVWVDPETSALVILDVTCDDQKGRYVSVFLNGTMHGLFENGPSVASDVGQIATRYFAAHRIYPPVDPS